MAVPVYLGVFVTLFSAFTGVLAIFSAFRCVLVTEAGSPCFSRCRLLRRLCAFGGAEPPRLSVWDADDEEAADPLSDEELSAVTDDRLRGRLVSSTQF